MDTERENGVAKTVVITGASAGIGSALAREFAGRGYSLGLTGRRLSVLETLQTELKGLGAPSVEVARVDVDDRAAAPAQLQALFEALGGVDIVVINAGINDFTRVGGGDLEREVAIINTNLIGAVATASAAVAHFCQRGGGHIVGISSLASLQAIPRQAAYCASKAGFSMYLDALRTEHRANNIRVTQIRPGFVKTDIMENIEKYPFAVSAEKAATEIVKAVMAGKRDVFVPALPWRLMRPLLGHLPDAVWKRLAK